MLIDGQYSLDEGNPLASVTHERDLDEFLANAALADADFTTGEFRSTAVENRFLQSVSSDSHNAQSEARPGLLVVPPSTR